MTRAALIPLVLLGPHPVGAQEMVTDRPDFTESSSAVPRGTWQIETGVTWTDAGDEDETALAETLVRWGLATGWELRLAHGGHVRLDRPGRHVSSGLGALSVGAKVDLARQLAPLGGAEIALIVAIEAPTGGTETGSDEWAPEAVVAFGWDPVGRLSFGSNLGLGRPLGGDDRFTSAWASGVVGVDLGHGTGVFVELYAFNRLRPGGDASVTFQTGLAWALAEDWQLDLRAARRVTDEGPDLLLGAGVSTRF